MHDSNQVGTKYGTWGTTNDCTWCHADGSSNIKQIRTSINAPVGARPVVFDRITASATTQMGVMGNDQRSTLTRSTNVCEVCHHRTNYHQYSSVAKGAGFASISSTSHYNRQDCVKCHAHDKGFKASCGSCHLATPTSGSHTPHAVARSMKCETCHFGAAGSGAMHNNTKPSLGFMITGANFPGFTGDASTKYGSYSTNRVVAPLAESANTPYTIVTNSAAGRNSCNVYCHGNWVGAGGSLNAVWGGGPTQDVCGTCHAASTATAPPTAWPATGSHARHAGNGTGQMSKTCANCHGPHPDAIHVEGNVKLDMTGITATYQPAGSTSYATVTSTGKIAPSATYGNCNNSYCHSSAQNPTTGSATGIVYQQPQWGAANSGCGMCHSNMKTVAAGGGSQSSHNKHANASNLNLDCGVCHAGFTATTASYPNHINNQIDVAIATANGGGTYNGGTALNNGYSTCANTYCHSNGTAIGTAAPAANTSVAWGGTVTCSSCHGFPPSYTTGKVNSHIQHVTNNGYTCDYCHVKTTVTGSSIASGARHANKFYNVSGNAAKLTVQNIASYSGGVGCASQCHTSNMTWGSNTTANTCTKCHGTLTTAAVVSNAAKSPNIGAHLAHVHGTSSYSYSRELSCVECHANTSTGANFTGHMDGNKLNISFVNASAVIKSASTATAWSGTTAPNVTCSVYCHGFAMPKGDTGGTAKTPAWTNASLMTGTTANDCTLCHGNPPTTGTSAGTHSGKAPTSSCNGCHTHFTTAGGFATEADRRLHINGKVEGGDCVACHGSAVTIGTLSGTASGIQGQLRRAVSLEFTNTWSHVKGRAVTKWDCIVCHMEGDSTGSTTTAHGDGFLNLRDPDTGSNIKQVTFSGTPGSYTSGASDSKPARFIRNLNSSTIEADVAAIQINHCLKCHDSNGAINGAAWTRNSTGAVVGTALKPFNTTVSSTSTYYLNNIAAANTAGAIVDVNSSFLSTNASYHPVTAKNNNGFIGNTRLKAPWTNLSPNKTAGGTTVYGFLISCWDCHAASGTASTVTLTSTVTAHGGATTTRGAYAPTTQATLCVLCHADIYATSTSNHGSGSSFGSGGDSGRYTINRCGTCHGSYNSGRPWQGVDAHGFNQWAQLRTETVTPANSTKSGPTTTTGHRPYDFIRTNNLAHVNPNTVPASDGTWTPVGNKPGCVRGSAACGNSHGSWTPGGSF